MTFDPPEIEKGTEIKKPEMDPRREKREPRPSDPNWGIPESNNLPNDDKPSAPVQPGRGQAQFMRPESAQKDSNDRSGAV